MNNLHKTNSLINNTIGGKKTMTKKKTTGSTTSKKTITKKKTTGSTTGKKTMTKKKTTGSITGKKTMTKKKTTGSTTGKKTITKKKTTKKDKTGGQFDFLLGVGRIRGQKYEHWLEQRLVLHYNDIKFVNEVRKKFGYNVTSIGPSKFSKDAFCDRDEKNRKFIAPKVKCGKD